MADEPLATGSAPASSAADDTRALLLRATAALRRLPPAQLRAVTEFAEWELSRTPPQPLALASEGLSAAAKPEASLPLTGSAPEPRLPPQPTGTYQPLPPPGVGAKTDWERFAGESLAARLGIAALVLGVGFFVKYALDADLLGPLGRVLLAVLAGGALIGGGAWLRRSVPAFASVLTGGGISVLYLSGTLAFQQYHLIPQPVAFGLMVAVTAGAAALAVAWDRAELAVVALVGGFAAPLLLRTGVARYPALFTYLLILDAGMLALGLFKRWPGLARVAWPATAALFGGWLINQVVGVAAPPVAGPVGFGAALVALFLAYDGLWFVRTPDPAPEADRLLVGAQAVGLVLAGETLLNALGARAPGWAQVLLWFGGAAAFGGVGALVRLRGGARTGADALQSAGLGLATLGVPAVFSRFLLTLVWALEALALLATGLKWRARRLRVAGLLLFGLTLGHLVVVDVWAFSPFERVVAFVVIGGLLLSGSFLYQKLRAWVEGEPGPIDN